MELCYIMGYIMGWKEKGLTQASFEPPTEGFVILHVFIPQQLG